jgi:DNA replication protein DnaD
MSKEKGQGKRKAKSKQIITKRSQKASSSRTVTLYENIKKAVELNAKGKSGKEIAEIMKCNPSSVTRYLQHATKLASEEIAQLHDHEVAFQIQTTGELISTLKEHLLYTDNNENTRVDSGAAGQLLSALARRAKIFGLDKQAEEQGSRNGDGDTYNIVMARFEEAVERGAMKREEIPVLDL